MCTPAPRRPIAFLAAIISSGFAWSLFASQETKIKIEPGPRVMSAAEAALTPDPNAGAQHGIILLYETTRSDFATGSEITHHLRARIFTNEGRGLADITIPYFTERTDLRRWWAWVILPDGQTVELPRQDLKEGVVAPGGSSDVAVLKGALPGVVPGSVIDYGYEVWQRGLERSTRVPMQDRWPIRELRYKWRPWDAIPGAFRAHRTTSIGIVTKQDHESVLVAGTNIPAVLDEPWSPPDDEMRGSLTLYYRYGREGQKEFWDDVGGSFNRMSEGFAKEKLTREAMATMNIPAEADLQTRLKSAYDWIALHLTNTTLRTSEEIESAPDEPDKKDARTVKDLMGAGEGPGWQLDYLFMGVARILGADARLILAVDRSERYFDPRFLSVEQLRATLVSVRTPGEPDDKQIVVDPGSGLPYGQVPWWYSGVLGLMVTPGGAVNTLVRASEAVDNLSQTNVDITFNVQEGTAAVHWTRTANGQSGLRERREIRAMTPEQRVKRLDEYCGSSGDVEVSGADAPGLLESASPLKVECDLTLMNTSLSAQIGEYQFSFSGPWMEPVPEFTSETRTSPVVFPFARADRTTIEIQIPEGFNDRTVPSPVKIDTPYGRYVLDVKPTAKGFHVERLFSLSSLGLPREEYAALRAYITGVHRADQTMLSFRKSDGTQ